MSNPWRNAALWLGALCLALVLSEAALAAIGVGRSVVLPVALAKGLVLMFAIGLLLGWQAIHSCHTSPHPGTSLSAHAITREAAVACPEDHRATFSIDESWAQLTPPAAGEPLGREDMGAWDWDLRTGRVHGSPECASILGVERLPEEQGLFRELVHPDDRARFAQSIERALDDRAEFAVEFRLAAARDTGRWVSIIGQTYCDAAGQSARVTGVVQDITEAKRIQDDICRSQEMLRFVLDNVPQGVFWKDRDGRFLGCNRMVAHALGMSSSAELIGRSHAELASIAPDEAAAFDRLDREVIEADTASYHILQTMTLADGRTIWLDTCKVPMHDLEGRVIGVLGTWEDVTERRTADLALQEERDRFAKLAATAPGVICSFRLRPDRTICVPYSSPKIAAIYGATPAELAVDGSPVIDLIHPEDMRRIKESVAESARSMSPWRETYRICRPAGGVIWVEGHSTPTREPDGSILWQGFVTDVTQRKEAEAALQFQHALLCSQAEASPDGILVVGTGDRLLSTNRRFFEVWGIPEEAAASGDDAPVLAQACNRTADRVEFLNRVEEIYADPDTHSHDEVLLDDGRTLERYSGPIRGELGELLGRVWFFRDITDRKLAEQSLRDRERLLGIVTNSARVGLVVISGSYEYLFANAAYAEILDLESQCIVGRRVPDLLSAGWSQIQPHLDRALMGERVSHEQNLLTVGDSDALPRTYRMIYQPTTGDDGEPNVVVVVVDITEQKRSSEIIRESEERYRRLVDLLPGAVFIHTGSEIVFCNPAFVRLMGAASAEQIIGRRPFDLADPDYHEIIIARINAMNATGEASPGIELRILRLDGRSIPVYSVSTPLPDRGRPAYLVALSDLTERERSMELLQSVLASVSDAILTITEHGVIRSANAATERLFGYPKNELIGSNFNVLLPEASRSQHDWQIANDLRSEEFRTAGVGRQFDGRRKDGSTFPFELAVTEFRLDGVRHFTSVIRDITARRQLEERFQQAQKMEAIGRLAGGVAHDFNNLLTIINGYGDLLLMDLEASDPQRESVVAIRDAGDRAARLTSQLLAFSRKAVIEPRILDLNALIAHSTKMLRRLIGEDVALLVLPDPALARVKADPGQLEQVIMNLIVNARDSMPTGGRLTLSTRDVVLGPVKHSAFPDLKPGRYAMLIVEDTGQGMSEAVKSKIFEPFFTTKEFGKGTGLGLAVVHGVVQQCGGQIEVQTGVGRGTAFRVLFPAVGEVDPATSSNEHHGGAKRGTETILLVEDEAAVRRIARLALDSQGYHVLEAASGAEALALSDQYPDPIQLLVTDVVMPSMGGRQLAEAMRLRRPGLRVLYVSGHTDDAVVVHGVVASVESFLQKPFTPRSLAQKVRTVLDAPPPRLASEASTV